MLEVTCKTGKAVDTTISYCGKPLTAVTSISLDVSGGSGLWRATLGIELFDLVASVFSGEFTGKLSRETAETISFLPPSVLRDIANEILLIAVEKELDSDHG